jgi:hypothetical protein
MLQERGCFLLDSSIKDIVAGHRESTLNTLWRVLLHFKVLLLELVLSPVESFLSFYSHVIALLVSLPTPMSR